MAREATSVRVSRRIYHVLVGHPELEPGFYFTENDGVFNGPYSDQGEAQLGLDLYEEFPPLPETPFPETEREND